SAGGEHRIATGIRRDGDERIICHADCACELRRRLRAVKHERAWGWSRISIQNRGALGAAHRADDVIELATEFRAEVLAAIAEAKTEECGHYCRASPSAAAHSAISSGSASLSRRVFAHALSRWRSSRLSAQTAAPRTSGDSSSRSRSASAARLASPELPIVISTLRTKRARPMRLTALLANSARKAPSSSRARSASIGARSLSRAANFASRPATAKLFQGQTARQSSQP